MTSRLFSLISSSRHCPRAPARLLSRDRAGDGISRRQPGRPLARNDTIDGDLENADGYCPQQL